MTVRPAVTQVAAALAARPWHVGLGAFVAGLAAAPLSRAAVIAIAAAALCVGAGLRRPRLALLATAAVVAGGLAATARLERLDRSELGTRPSGAVAVRAALDDPVRTSGHGGWSAAATVTSGRGRGERIVLRAGRWVRPLRASVGDVVSLRGRLAPLAPYESYQRIRGAHAALIVQGAAAVGRRRGGVPGRLDAVRRRAESGVTAGLPPAQAALARGMVLGQDDALGDDERGEFRASGLSHVLRSAQ